MMSLNFRHASRVAALIGLIAGIPGLAAASTACPNPATGAFTGCYYNNQTLSGDPVFVRTDNQIDFYWGTAPRMPPCNRSISPPAGKAISHSARALTRFP